MPPKKIKVVDVINNIDDNEQHENEIKAIENEQVEEQQVEQPTEEQPPQPTGLGQQPIEETTIKTVELVECPDCNKKLTKKSLKYSHAKNCPANKPKEGEETKEEYDNLLNIEQVTIQEPKEEEEEETKRRTTKTT